MERQTLREIITPYTSRQVIAYAILAGIVATFLGGYYFGRINHIEQLPQIFRAMDHNYLREDFAVNSTATYGPRFFYTRLLALAGRLVPLPVVFLVFACLQNAAVAFVTFLAARWMFRTIPKAAVVACVLVLAVRSVKLGEADYLVMPALIPASLVTAPALLAVLLGLVGDNPLAAAAALPAVLIHPLLGLLCGGLGVRTIVLTAIARRDWRRCISSLVVAVGFAAVGLLLWVVLPGESGRLSVRELLEIYGRFRAPHHILPSTFPLADYAAVAALAIAAGIAARQLLAAKAIDSSILHRMAVVAGLILLLWIGGYVFVEVFPSRLWIIAQTFRLVLVVKWLGLLLLAGSAALLLEAQYAEAPCIAGVVLTGSGYAQPFLALWGQLLCWWRHRRTESMSALILVLLLAVSLLIHVLLGVNPRELHAMTAIGTISALFWGLRTARQRYCLGFGLGILWIGLIVINRYQRLPLLGTLFGYSAPTFTIEQAGFDMGLARAARALTPQDAVFLTPPDFGQFRLTAQRAIVVDFKYAMPGDSTLQEWRQRLVDCYGEVKTGGWGAAAEMDSNWRNVTDSRLLALARKYRAGYAVLYRETPTGLRVIYRNPRYALAVLPPAVSLVVFRTGGSPVADPKDYFEWIRRAASVEEERVDAYYVPAGGMLGAEEARAHYEEAVADGRMPALGSVIKVFSGTDPYGVPVTALFFDRESLSEDR